MGYYLNSTQALTLYKSEFDSPYFVDKSLLLEELFPLVKIGNKHVCITRPRRFGKSVMAAMVASFFGRGIDSSNIFDSLKVAKRLEAETEKTNEPAESAEEPSDAIRCETECLAGSSDAVLKSEMLKHNDEKFDYRDFMNQYNVIYINFIGPANDNDSYQGFIDTVKENLQEDLREAYPDVRFRKHSSAIQDMDLIFAQRQEKFIFVMDEWDCIFHKTYTSDEDRRSFINWLAALTKDKAYVALTYMTGVLPIAKYSSGSTINHFDEYTMTVQPKFSEFFGFTEKEVDMLFQRYLKNEKNPVITREDLKLWYDGYHTAGGGERLYNPRSVVKALSNNCLASYWTTSGSYGEIAAYIKNDRADIRKDVALMVTGEAVPADVEEYAATAMQLTTRNEILSAMVVYGFLNYEDGKVRIPNKELMDEFAKTIRRMASFSN